MPLSVEFQLFISRSAWSASLTEEQLARIQKDAFEQSYSAGALVCHQGSPPDHWLGVIDGFVKVDTVSKEGRSTTLAGVPAGSWFGEGAVEIGRLSGLSRQNTNRAMRELADAGLLMIEYGSVRILDVAGLRDLYRPEE